MTLLMNIRLPAVPAASTSASLDVRRPVERKSSAEAHVVEYKTTCQHQSSILRVFWSVLQSDSAAKINS